MFQRAFRFTVNSLFPVVCLCCHRDVEISPSYPICSNCQRTFKPAFPKPPKGVDALYCAVVFEGAARELIHMYKYKGKEYLSDFFSHFCANRWSLPVHQIDALVAVPHPWWKTFTRGFNPPEELAQRLAKTWKRPLVKDVLIRNYRSCSQTQLNRQDRRSNAVKSYEIKNNVPRTEGGTVLLVDDVFTTGATISVCAKLLKQAGFKRVIAATIAYDPKVLLPKKGLSNRIRGSF